MRLVLILLFLMAYSAIETVGQHPTTQVITADNVNHLHSVARIDFDGFTGEWGEINAGWFALDTHGTRALIRERMRHIVFDLFDPSKNAVVNDTGDITDAAFVGSTGAYLLLTRQGAAHEVIYYAEDGAVLSYSLEDFSGIPLAVWPDDTATARAWLEIMTFAADTNVLSVDLEDSAASVLTYGPEDDPEAVVRIGRIPPPYVVTSSLQGLVKLWNLETKETIFEADNGTEQPSVFGNINADATHLVWRDNASSNLYLLDFVTGENQFVAELDGAYVQWFFLSHDASVILGINLAGEPVVVAWDVSSGERYVLGEYRPCDRPQPDMVRLSEDGTTLVIGCDGGLEVWRVHQED